MDGNRRWAKKRFLPDIAGHRSGALNIEKILICASELEIPYVTFYTFSTENWSRNEVEVSDLFNLMREYVLSNLSKFQEDERFIFKIIGDVEKLPIDLQDSLKKLESISKEKKQYTTTAIFAINYGGRDEIVRSVNKILSQKSENNYQISEDDILDNLDTKGIPDVDIMIRTGGNQRISNFLIFQSIYAELFFTDTLWPDFSKNELHLIIDEYKKRVRKYGK